MPTSISTSLTSTTDRQRKHIGEKLCHWHASMNDPIYAVGSFYLAGQAYPDDVVVRAARHNLIADLGKPSFQSADDQCELREIIAYLDAVLGETSELPATEVDVGFEDFVRCYLTCMLWSTNDESTPDGGEPLDAHYGIEDIAPAALETLREGCRAFYDDNRADFTVGCDGTAEEYAGHNFWLTRNGHGAGFWDGRYEKAVGQRLTAACRKFRGIDPYVGDDGQIYV